MVSFDVVSLYTNVPLEDTIKIILRKIYKEKAIKTKIPRNAMEKLLHLCTQGVPFTFNGDMYTQTEGVVMGSPLGAIFANIFMSELEKNVIPKLGSHISHWNRYMGENFAFVKPGSEETVLTKLNSYHSNIKFTYEKESLYKIPFLDVLITRENGKLETQVYRKPTSTNIYLNWNSYAPRAWKITTVKSLVSRALMISSTDEYLKKEIKYIENVLHQYNEYPKKVIQNVIKTEMQKHKDINNPNQVQNPSPESKSDDKTVTLMLPYAGQKGEQVIYSLRKKVSECMKKVKSKTKLRIVYKSQKLEAKFNTKDKTKSEHMHNIVYHAKCPNQHCDAEYTGQTRCRLKKRATEHNKTDKKSHILTHSKKTKHRRVWMKDFTILGSGYQSNFKRRISEALYIKTFKPNLNVQKETYSLSLFN